jgi:rhodanese-related sulfurtransferase
VDFVFYMLLTVFVLWMLYKSFAPLKGLRTLTPEQFRNESRDGRVIDVREAHEYNRGHIKGAVNVPLSQLQQRLKDIPRDRAVYLYCQSGMRSKQAARLLVRQGYARLAHLRGGMMSWTGPVQK